jgi:hypothetical protein
MRRIFIIIAIVLLIIALGVGVYFMFFAKQASVVVSITPSTGLPIAGQTAVTTPETPVTAPTTTPTNVSARLVQISTGPVVSGEVVVNIPTTNTSSPNEVSVSFIERQSGNVFSYLKQAKTLTRINNKTIPGIQSAAWLPGGSTAFVRYLSGNDFSTVNTYALSATSSTGFFLPQNLSDVSIASTSILTLASGVNGSIASLARADGSHTATLFTTPLTSLRVSFAGKNQYLAFSKPAATLPGYAFLVGSTGHFSRIAGPLNGLVALASPSGKWILVSYTQNTALAMKLVNTTTNESINLPVATIADKCVWTIDESSIYCGIPIRPDTSAEYPDDWYQGAVQFSDRIWKIQVAGRYAQLVLDFSQVNNGTLDAVALALDPLNSTLVFVNKNDGSLWSYSL